MQIRTLQSPLTLPLDRIRLDHLLLVFVQLNPARLSDSMRRATMLLRKKLRTNLVNYPLLTSILLHRILEDLLHPYPYLHTVTAPH